MEDFEQLSSEAQAARLRALAVRALEAYALDVREVRLVGLYTNAIFRVATTDDSSYMMRVCQPGWRTDTDLRSEAMWLQALDRETDIGAPRPVMARDGAYLVRTEAEGVPEAHRCCVMSWTPGVVLEDERLTEENLFQMGALFARLHAQAADFEPPAGFTQRRMDTLFARGEEDALFSAENREAFTPRAWEIIERVRAQVAAAYEQLYADPAGLRVIHHDLWHGNIKIHAGRLYPLDFEDTVWGYPVQDIAMAWQDLMKDVAPESYEPLTRAFRAGYEQRLAWPESYAGQIDLFRAGRMLWVANYVARFERKYLSEHLTWLTGEFEKFLETGTIRKG